MISVPAINTDVSTPSIERAAEPRRRQRSSRTHTRHLDRPRRHSRSSSSRSSSSAFSPAPPRSIPWSSRPPSRRFPTVNVIYPTPSTLSSEIALPGNAQAFTDTPIYSRTNGYLKSWYFDIGAQSAVAN